MGSQYTNAQQRELTRQKAEAEQIRLRNAAKSTEKPAEIQRDQTSLGALAKQVAASRPLASRDLRSKSPVGLARPAARSLKTGGR